MVARLTVAALAAALAAGCVAVQVGPKEEPPAPVVGDWCDLNEPRHPSRAVVAAMTRAELDELNAHNRYGAEHCGWTP